MHSYTCISIYSPETLGMLFQNDHFLAGRNRWQTQLASMGESADSTKERRGFFYASFPVIRHQLIALKLIIQGRKITDYKHEVVFIKATNQSWEDPDTKPREDKRDRSSHCPWTAPAVWPGLAQLAKDSTGLLVEIQSLIIREKLEALLSLSRCPEHFSPSIFIYRLLI